MKQKIIEWEKINSDLWQTQVLDIGRISTRYILKRSGHKWTAYRGDEMTSLRGYDLDEIKKAVQSVLNSILI